MLSSEVRLENLNLYYFKQREKNCYILNLKSLILNFFIELNSFLSPFFIQKTLIIANNVFLNHSNEISY